MDDALTLVISSLSMADNNYSMWDKEQILVILSRTKTAKDTIFAGYKESSLNALVIYIDKGHNGHNIWTVYWR